MSGHQRSGKRTQSTHRESERAAPARGRDRARGTPAPPAAAAPFAFSAIAVQQPAPALPIQRKPGDKDNAADGPPPPLPNFLRVEGEEQPEAEGPGLGRPKNPGVKEPDANISAPTDVRTNAFLSPSIHSVSLAGEDFDPKVASGEDAIKRYYELTYVDLQEMGRHRYKINRYIDYLQADYVAVSELMYAIPAQEQRVKTADNALGQAPDADSQKARRAELTEAQKELADSRKRLGTEKDPKAAQPAALARFEEATKAGAVVDAEYPIVDHAFTEIEKLKKQGETLGSKKSREAGGQRPQDFAEANRTRAAELAKQSKLSRSLATLKRQRLKSLKKLVKKELKRGMTFGAKVALKAKTAAKSAVVSVATGGFVELDTETTGGGYGVQKRVVLGWNDWRKQWAELSALAKARPYGRFTTIHVVLKGFGELVLKPIRNLSAGLATLFAVLSFVPGAAVVAGPAAALASVIAVMAGGAKVLVDAVLLTWNLFALAFNTNPRNTDLLRGQSAQTAVNMTAGAVKTAGAFAAPMVANTQGAQYNTPVESAKTVLGGPPSQWNTGSTGVGDLPTVQEMVYQKGALVGVKTGVKQGANLASKGIEKTATLPTKGGGQENTRFKEEAIKEPSARPRSKAPVSEVPPPWMEAEMRREQALRGESRDGAARKLATQLGSLVERIEVLRNQNREAAEHAQALRQQVPANANGVQPADRENANEAPGVAALARQVLGDVGDGMRDAVGMANDAAGGRQPPDDAVAPV